MFGYVEMSKAELLMFDADRDPEWFAVVAPVAIFDGNHQYLGTKWACTDGNVLAVLHDKPGIHHPVWSECDYEAPYVFEHALFPFQSYTDELGDNGDYAHVAEDCFSILLSAVYLYESVRCDPDTFDWLISQQ